MDTPGDSQHEATPVCTRIRTNEHVARAATWEIVDHDGCLGHGALQALAPGDAAPRCPVCGVDVVWQLTHLAPSVAADHRGVGRLP